MTIKAVSDASWILPGALCEDIFPLVGSIKNAVDLFLTYCWKPQDPTDLSPVLREYYKHVHGKTVLEKVLLIIPILGTVVGFVILLTKYCRKESNLLQAAKPELPPVQDPIAQVEIEPDQWPTPRLIEGFQQQLSEKLRRENEEWLLRFAEKQCRELFKERHQETPKHRIEEFLEGVKRSRDEMDRAFARRQKFKEDWDPPRGYLSVPI